MQRTQIYLTVDQRTRIATRAKERSCAQSEIIRELLDRGLGINPVDHDSGAAIRETAGLLADAPDWQEWQRSVRGRTAEERLSAFDM